VRASTVPREEITVTTKLPGRHHGFDGTLHSFEEPLSALGLDHVDLSLIHWPLPRIGRYVDSWRAMIRPREEGVVRSIGVSNFTPDYLRRLLRKTDVAPAVNQVELHPAFPQDEVLRFPREHDIVTESWSPLGTRTTLTASHLIAGLAEAHGVTPTQVGLRWHVQLRADPEVGRPQSAAGEPRRRRIRADGRRDRRHLDARVRLPVGRRPRDTRGVPA